MVDHIANRDKIVEVLARELMGPAPQGDEIDTSRPVIIENYIDAYKPYIEKGTGEEIIQRPIPSMRYGVGVLYPLGTQEEEKTDGQDSIGMITSEDEMLPGSGDGNGKDELIKNTEKALEAVSGIIEDQSASDFDLSSANRYKPSTLGVSFLADFSGEAKLFVQATGGYYRALEVQVAGSKRTWYVRTPVKVSAEFSSRDILVSHMSKVSPTQHEELGAENLKIQVEVYSHPHQYSKTQRLVTVCLINRSEGTSQDRILFQSYFKATVVSTSGTFNILPYPRPPFEKLDEEEKSLELLYRKVSTYAVGHGCAAGWDKVVKDQRASFVTAECLPIFETPSTTPDVTDESGAEIKIPMAPLAGLIKGDNGFAWLESVVESYEKWISRKEAEVLSLDESYRETARLHLFNCKDCARRMRKGIEFLHKDSLAYRAFQLANYAILLQQVHTRKNRRSIRYDAKAKRMTFSEDFVDPDPLGSYPNKGHWRAFQVAFLLMSIESTANPSSIDRDIVELIWFPTGGGKTEAYLALAAFSLFLRRLHDPSDTGVHVLMRYTLRLLTTQQFQRAARLVCAMEHIRQLDDGMLGTKPFSLGLWVGYSNTPNTRVQALQVLRGLSSGNKQVKNKFVIDQCPWCGAEIGPIDDVARKNKAIARIHGYVQVGGTVVFKCPDQHCEFKAGIPVFVIDEDIYVNTPSMVIGTVDKFAMLAWKAEARSLFGIGIGGQRVHSPPGLIVQDELHLISGPLGSMVGLYEAVIEELCTDRRPSQPILPKIVSSTATIRRYKEQVKALYARDRVILFPPPGIEDGDSFFAKHATKDDGTLAPGRMYVGVGAPGLGSMQTVQVRTFTALLQAPMFLPEDERDPWWTLLVFFNSLRELGTTLSLLQADIPDYQQVFINRLTDSSRTWRSFTEVKELTGRADSEDIPKAISALEKRYTGKDPRPIDVCLASNILEVGVDIDRLSLISVVGQPKTTSQYIQVTGRIGRSWWERPGLVVTAYYSNKPRDRSHFEKFRSYHQRLYAQVEPSSVTPFSPPALDRALHAVLSVYAHQVGGEHLSQSPFPYPGELVEDLKAILLPRVRAVDPQEAENFEKVFDERAEQWQDWQPVNWTASYDSADIPLLWVAGDYATPEQKNHSWPTMQSMRSVDAECIAEIASPSIMEGDSRDAE